MDSVVIPKDRFEALADVTTVSGFNGKVSKHIFNIFSEFRDQKVFYTVDYETFIDDESKVEYENFGIYLNIDKITRDIENRRYLLIIDHSVGIEGMPANVREFVDQYLPEGATPTHFVVDKTMEYYEELVKWNNAVRQLYPGIVPLAANSVLIHEKGKEAVLDDLYDELKEVELAPLDIGESLHFVNVAFNNMNRGTIEAIRSLERYVSFSHKKGQVLFSSNKDRTGLSVASAYFFYNYGIEPQLGYAETNLYLGYLSDLLFSRNRMLVEDQLSYLKGLPDLMFRMNEGIQFMIVPRKNEMICRVRVSCIDVDKREASDLEKFDLDLDKISVIPLEYEFNIKGKDGESIRPVHDELLELFIILEDKLRMFNTTANVTNTFFMEHEGTKYLAYVEHIDLKLPAMVAPIHNELVIVPHTFGIDDVSSLYPVNVLPGWRDFVGKFIRDLKRETEHEITSLAFYKHPHSLGLLVNFYNTQGPNIIKVEGEVDFVTLGLWWYETYRYRMFLLKDLAEYVDLREFRKSVYGKHLSVFGGPHPMLSREFVITEEFLRSDPND